ncbi:major facilitator superfamily domain-containing protein [Zychaea mexicana]|uniref:major facilitator superfamily domain-containing protein n=1 Tax=Zychaea mexicana TaxID=64656 RepID=UPI0022FF0918|nr:major facilitator superfamily domain-containing protein [Zychaea mexicana]KAI9484856.1 major facilitator superfamily domain-containing protein [Zychaea mexicana]
MPYLAPKLLYTFLFACQGSAPVYLALFYSSQLGLKSDQIGLLVAIAPFISAIACPLWTAVADKTKTHRYIMCIVHTLATLAIVSVMGISVAVQHAEPETERSKLTVTLVTITSVCFAFFGVPVGPLVDGGVLKILGRNKDQYGRQRMFGSISFGVASCLVGFITDWTNDMNAIFYVYAISAVCFIIVAGSTQFKTEKLDTFIRRPFLQQQQQQVNPLIPKRTKAAPVPFASSSTSTAHSGSSDGSTTSSGGEGPTRTDSKLHRKIKQFQLDYSTYDDDDEFEATQIRQNEIQRLIQFATESSIIEAVNLSNPPASRRRYSGVNLDEVANATQQPTSLIELLKQPHVLLFFMTMMLMGASLNMVISFLFIFLKQDLGASSSVVGLTGLVGSVTELLFFFYSRDLIRLFGIKSLIILGHVLTIVRVFSYTILPKGPSGANVALGLHLLNGVAFSALWGAGVVQADELAPPSLQATSQGLLAAMYAGVGAGLGSLMGGVIYERAGPHAMFYAAIGLTSLSLELYLEANTRWGITDMLRWTYRMTVRMYTWTQHVRGRGRAVPRWSGPRREGRIRLRGDGDDD